jgi:16S rRNA (adenine(1408)-N(1))-methyltransferase
VTIHFPWGSLLRGVTYGDDPVIAPLASLVRPGGRLDLVVQTADVAVDAFASHGLGLVDRHVATPAEVSGTRSSWAKRLGIGPGRPAFAFHFGRLEDG